MPDERAGFARAAVDAAIAQELRAAEVMLRERLYSQVVAHAYVAALHAARAAIAGVGQNVPKTHSGTTAAFGALLVERGADREAGRALNLLEDLRQDTLYELAPKSLEEATDAVRLARVVVEGARDVQLPR